ncbi:MAG: hypothetical protein V1816_02110 [Pseudomonadota bacterium]
MKKNDVFVVLTRSAGVLLLAAVLMGMGGKNAGPQKIPSPEQNYSVAIIDRAEVRTEASMFSIDGYVYFFGRKGKGQLAVPFNKIKTADFRQTPDGLEVKLVFRDGRETILAVDRDRQCYGKTGIGNIQVGLDDVKMILFGDKPPDAAPRN